MLPVNPEARSQTSIDEADDVLQPATGTRFDILELKLIQFLVELGGKVIIGDVRVVGLPPLAIHILITNFFDNLGVLLMDVLQLLAGLAVDDDQLFSVWGELDV